jgi:hypothetical protein
MKKLMTISAIAIAAALAMGPAHADTIDPNNPNVTNPRVDADGQRDIQARWDECKTLQSSLVNNATQQQMDAFGVQCADFIDQKTGQIAADPSVTNQQMGVESNTARD